MTSSQTHFCTVQGLCQRRTLSWLWGKTEISPVEIPVFLHLERLLTTNTKWKLTKQQNLSWCWLAIWTLCFSKTPIEKLSPPRISIKVSNWLSIEHWLKHCFTVHFLPSFLTYLQIPLSLTMSSRSKQHPCFSKSAFKTC